MPPLRKPCPVGDGGTGRRPCGFFPQEEIPLKKILTLALAMLMLAAGAAWAAAPKTVLRMSIGDPDNSDMGIVANAFKKYVEEKSNGTVEVEIFYAGGLGEDEGVQFRNTQTGKLDLALGGIANLEPMVKRLGVLTLPYLFNDIEQVKGQIAVKNDDLKAKKEELATIVESTAAEEAQLRAKRDACAAKIDARTMSAYERIRNSSNNKLAVVSVFNGDSCGGCFNTIPPQRLIDIASNRKMIICEYCGRILVNPDFE